jgi:hypothetical protein
LEMAVAAGTRIGFIGAGQMAEAIAKGLNSAGVVRCDQMIAADVNLGRCKVFQSLGIAICGSNSEVQILNPKPLSPSAPGDSPLLLEISLRPISLTDICPKICVWGLWSRGGVC